MRVQKKKNEFVFNLIDTPGHVDFTYEVSRSLAACEGTLLLVDAVQGVEAQTVSNAYLAIDNDLTIIPVVNKVDLPSARIDIVKDQLIELIGCEKSDIISVSAKKGEGIEDIFNAIINKIPPPEDRSDKPLRAMIFDSVHDNYKGAIPYIRVFDGVIRAGEKAKFFAHNNDYDITEVGHFVLKQMPAKELRSGDVGYFLASIRDVSHVLPGDTITNQNDKNLEPLPGFKDIKPMVFSGLYPSDSDDYDQLRMALEKLKLNDASLIFDPETSQALGFGFRCGFLGLLHMEIIQERLEREFDISLVTTTPNVRYRIVNKAGETIEVDTPAKWKAEKRTAAKNTEPIFLPISPHLNTNPKTYAKPVIKITLKTNSS